MITVLTIHVKMAPRVITQPTTSLVPVLQNTREHYVKHVIFVTAKPATSKEIATMENSIILVNVNHNIPEQTVNKEITVIAILVGMERVRIQNQAFIVLVQEDIPVHHVK